MIHDFAMQLVPIQMQIFWVYSNYDYTLQTMYGDNYKSK